ncbi:YidC/Oxa1 family membrane protein insertase [Acidaminococcus sp. NSJ-142]|uniref:YidC/Oxa1 family membrane protein insertase n=1 Tax=Acidaminococcus TaxID=904 RepID=UPI000CF932C2|nr:MULTISPECIES: YidC/Oxa1 family membrane protein insertase [Acidaminococcus]MCD2434428.1 YidC/Oxa1 family membrane protein insertase [Acidaminococcus hominis]MCH4096820.1 YidC/Oxa1 family membrane protein insertase [Acidaminococcus provencensis]RHK03716.1 membrane protein insertase YidC [Acidaminococcus sp. AM05-11]
MQILSSFVQQVVGYIYELTRFIGEPSYGLAIIIMTILIKLLLSPLTAKQIASTKAMSRIQPKMKELQARYKDDKVTLNQKLSELYKKEGVNPLAGCLPLIVQMPIMIGIFYGIRDFQYAGPSSFLWMSSIADPDPLYILPILSALTTFIQSKQTMPPSDNPQGKIMLYFMPLFIGYISLKFPAGLVLYWVVMNIMQIGQQFLLDRKK